MAKASYGMRPRPACRFIALAALVLTAFSQAQVLRGRVVDSRYGTGIDSVRISMKGGAPLAYTDSTGRFSVESGTPILTQQARLRAGMAPFWDGTRSAFQWDPSARSVRVRIFDARGAMRGDFRPRAAAGHWTPPRSGWSEGFLRMHISVNGGNTEFHFLFRDGRLWELRSPAGDGNRRSGSARGGSALAKAAAPGAVWVLEKRGWTTREITLAPGVKDTTLPLGREKIKVLIVDGFNNHNWKQTTVIAKAILDQTGFFSVQVSTSPAAIPTSAAYQAWKPDFRAHEAVLLNVCNINTALGWPDSIRKAFTDFVSAGGAVYAFHAAAASFSDWPEYVRLIGFTWAGADYGPSYEIFNGFPREIPAGTGSGTGHGSRFDALVHTPSHPIFRGLPASWLTTDTEVYTYPRTLPGAWSAVTTMGYAQDETGGSGKAWPLMVMVKYGRGQAFTSLLGHLDGGEVYPDRLADLGLHTTLIRSLEWMTRREVIFPAPAGFPTATRTGRNQSLPLGN